MLWSRVRNARIETLLTASQSRIASRVCSEKVREQYQRGLREPFSAALQSTPKALLSRATALMDDEAYDKVKKVLAALDHLHLLNRMVDPPMDAELARKQIHEAVKERVNVVRTADDTSSHCSYISVPHSSHCSDPLFA